MFRRRTEWTLADGEERHRLSPESFPIPSEGARADVQAGDLVKLIFEPSTGIAERMWVTVTTGGDQLVGTLNSDPAELHGLRAGDAVPFERRHVIAIGRRPV